MVDLFGDFADQFVNVQAREHCIGDGDQDAKVITLAAQQIVIDVVADPALNLFSYNADYLGEGLQPVVLFFTPRTILVTDEFTAAKDAPIRRQRQQAVVAKFRIQSASGQLWPGFSKFVIVAVQRIGAGQNTAYRAMSQYRFVFIIDGFTIFTRRKITRTLRLCLP